MLDDFKPVRPKRPQIRLPKREEPIDQPEQEVDFVPPEEIVDMAEEEQKLLPKETKTKKLVWWNPKTYHKKQWIIVGILTFVLLAGGTAFALTRPNKPVVSIAPPIEIEPPKPTTEASLLTGVQVKPELNKLPITGVMIENSPDARPQSGLRDAGVVFEAIAEGGITRFLALFQHNDTPSYIGPIRSARPYYLDWAMPFEAGYAHVGGSPDAIAQIRSLGVRDLDQFYNPGPYNRVSTRYAPHNMYSSLKGLMDLQKQKGYTKSSFTSFARKEDAAATTPTASKIDLKISSDLYNVHYDYNKKSNSYSRIMAGKPHVDEKSKKQITPKVVVALVMNYGVASDGIHSTYKTTGSGSMYIFQDGKVTKGTWTKKDRKKQFSFTDAEGKVLAFNAGQTWFSVVGEKSDVVYK